MDTIRMLWYRLNITGRISSFLNNLKYAFYILRQPDIFSRHKRFIQGFLFYIVDDFISKNREVMEKLAEYTDAQFSEEQVAEFGPELIDYFSKQVLMVNDILEMSSYWNSHSLEENNKLFNEMAMRLIRYRNDLNSISFQSTLRSLSGSSQLPND